MTYFRVSVESFIAVTNVLWTMLQIAGTYDLNNSLPALCTPDVRPIYLLQKVIPNRYYLPRGVSIEYDSTNNIHAYRFSVHAGTLRFPAKAILTRCDFFPDEFSLLVTLKASPQTRRSEEYLFAVIPNNSINIKMGVRLSHGRVILDYSDHVNPPGSRKAVFKNARVSDGKWHTFIISVGGNTVSLRVDCGKPRNKRLKRTFPAFLKTKGDNIHIANRKIGTAQFSGLLKQILIVPGSDVSRQACPSAQPNLPDIAWQPDIGGLIPSAEPVFKPMNRLCTWRDTGKIWFDVYSNALKVCYSGVWRVLTEYPTDVQEEAAVVTLDYIEDYDSIKTASPSIDLEIFDIPKEGKFMALANFNSSFKTKQPSAIYKWTNRTFVKYQNLTTYAAECWEFFQIGNQFFLAVANSGLSGQAKTSSTIYRWRKRRKKFRLHQELVTYTARDIEHFEIDGDHFLAVANHEKDGSNLADSMIFKWNHLKKKFVEYQKIPTMGAYDWTYFRLENFHLLVVANAFDGRSTQIFSNMFIWQKDMFVPFQDFETTGATDWESFTIGDDVFLAVANSYNFGPQNPTGNDRYSTNSIIYKLNREKKHFEKFQTIPTNCAVDWEFFKVGSDSYLILSNAQYTATERNQDVAIVYRWQGAERFVPAHYLHTLPSTDWEVFQDGGETFLASANPSGQITQVLRAKTKR